MKKVNAILLLVSVLILFGHSVQANVEVASLFADHMVLHADKEITGWGKSDMMELVTTELNHMKVSTRAVMDEKWSLRFPAMKYGGSCEPNIFADDTVTFKNILIGENGRLSGRKRSF